MTKALHAGLAAAVLAAAMPAQAAEPTPLVLKPDSPWVADFQKENCAVRRSFSGEGQQVTVEFDDYGRGESFDVSLMGVTLKPQEKPLRAGFVPDDALALHPETLTLTSPAGTALIYSDTVFRHADVEANIQQSMKQGYPASWDKEVQAAREKEITSLSVADAFERDLQFNTGSLSKAMGVMRQCLDGVAKAKGLDPAALATLSRQPAPKDAMQWWPQLTAYPKELGKEKKTGTVRLRLLIDEKGKPADCYAHPMAEDPRFDTAACAAALKNARFAPALDAAGNPTKGFWSARVSYIPH